MNVWIALGIVWIVSGVLAFAFSTHLAYLVEKLGIELDDDEYDWRDDFFPHLITYAVFGLISLSLFVLYGPLTKYLKLLSKNRKNAASPRHE
ncbi:MAG TPA: hypothetical protein VJB92_03575 [Candidatus Paceibacterota bacterium]